MFYFIYNFYKINNFNYIINVYKKNIIFMDKIGCIL